MNLLIVPVKAVDARPEGKGTALLHAVGMGHFGVVKVLLDRGASLNIEAQGHSPKSIAEARGAAEMVALLNEHDGNSG